MLFVWPPNACTKNLRGEPNVSFCWGQDIPFPKRVEISGEGGGAFNYGIVLGRFNFVCHHNWVCHHNYPTNRPKFPLFSKVGYSVGKPDWSLGHEKLGKKASSLQGQSVEISTSSTLNFSVLSSEIPSSPASEAITNWFRKYITVFQVLECVETNQRLTTFSSSYREDWGIKR